MKICVTLHVSRYNVVSGELFAHATMPAMYDNEVFFVRQVAKQDTEEDMIDQVPPECLPWFKGA